MALTDLHIGQIPDVDGDALVRVDSEATGIVVMDSIDRMVYLNPAQALQLADMLRRAATGSSL